ncbi:MAG: O-methyltransferase [Candidatus Odinarchaeota archaeon]
MSKVLEIMKQLEEEDRKQREAGLPSEERNRSISRDTGEFLALLVRIHKPRQIIEIGTSVGYSTLWLGISARTVNAKIISYEISEERVEKARKNLLKAELTEVVKIHHGDPRQARLQEVDLVFLDAEKADYIDHFNAVFPVLTKGGVVVADNVTSHGDELQDYILHVRHHPSCNSMLVPIGRGLEVTRKLDPAEVEVFKSLY